MLVWSERRGRQVVKARQEVGGLRSLLIDGMRVEDDGRHDFNRIILISYQRILIHCSGILISY